MTVEDESLANFWQGWPETARMYREQKQTQVQRLQTTVSALQDAVRERDSVLLSTMYALQDFARWWASDDLDGTQIQELERCAARIRALLNT